MRGLSGLGRGASTTLLAGVALGLFGGVASAEFRVCNTTHVLANVALGAEGEREFTTEGWWTLAPGDCETLIAHRLDRRYLYLYAMNISGAEMLAGPVRMCVDRVKFEVDGVTDCWRRGLMSVGFREIDTRDAADWVTFLTDGKP